MEELPFKVSAKSAQLIGRENISTDQGAMIELIKNSYDADAKKCIIYITNKYKIIPSEITVEDYQKFIKNPHFSSIKEFFERKNNLFFIKKDLEKKETDNINFFFKNLIEIFIIDNGEGMDENTIKNKWMFIGTSNKKYDYKTHELNRIKTGAKGIGRFALDKLGKKCNMITLSKNDKLVYEWKVNWQQFEDKEDSEIGEIKAHLNNFKNKSFYDEVRKYLPEKILEEFKENEFNHGTIINIQTLRSYWNESKIESLYEELEKLNPPNDGNFEVFLYSDFKKYGKIYSNITREYDYKIEGEVTDEGNLTINIHRNEFNLEILKEIDFFKKSYIHNSYKHFFEKNKSREEYLDIKYFNEEPIILKRKASDYKNINIDDFKDVGGFTFKFYFLKNRVRKEDLKNICYKEFDSGRTNNISNYLGLKIFRDNFRVRPYGEYKTSNFDWLLLDETFAKNRFFVTHSFGDWKVTSNQILGNVDISRVKNPNLEDSANRQGFIENDEFNLFKILIRNIISEFEKERQYVARRIRSHTKVIEEIKLGYVEEELNTKLKKSENINEIKREVLIKHIQNLNEKIKEKDDHIRVLSGLGSLGLSLGTYTHELNSIENSLEDYFVDLKEIITDIVSEEQLNTLESFENPFRILNSIEENHTKLKIWISFILNKLKTNRRRYQKYNLNKLIQDNINTWKRKLNMMNIDIVFESSVDDKAYIKTYPVDIDSIIINLIINSVDSFLKKLEIVKRKINIKLKENEKYLIIVYQDNGAGLDDKYKSNPNLIFEAQESSKKNSQNEEIGLGLGMWIVATTLNRYKAEKRITKIEGGFEFEMKFSKNELQYEVND